MTKNNLAKLVLGAALTVGMATAVNAANKCGAGKCGGVTEAASDKCGSKKKDGTGKGAGKCGTKKKDGTGKGAGKCGSKKSNKASKCGAGKCGSN